MIDPKKLQCYAMAHHLYGCADGIIDKDRYGALIYTLKKAAALLEDVWDEYQLTLPEDQQVMEKPL